MNSIDSLKTCRKGLHQYPADKKECPYCNRERSRRWREKNIEQEREKVRQWRKENPERAKNSCQRWYQKNAEKVKNKKQNWRKQNPEQSRQRTRNWRKQNPEKMWEYSNCRKEKIRQATPPWADLAAIRKVKAETNRLQRETGIPHHVDHIYPLVNPYLCGLHIAENLQPLPCTENLSKNNRSWPGQLECQRLPLHMNGFEVID